MTDKNVDPVQLKLQHDLMETLSLQFQQAIYPIVRSSEEAIDKAGLSGNDLLFTLGSAVASLVFELVRDADQNAGLTKEQTKAVGYCFEAITRGFADKMSVVKDPVEMTKITVMDGNIH